MQNILLTNYLSLCFLHQQQIAFTFINFLDDCLMVFTCSANPGIGHIFKITVYEDLLLYEKHIWKTSKLHWCRAIQG